MNLISLPHQDKNVLTEKLIPPFLAVDEEEHGKGRADGKKEQQRPAINGEKTEKPFRPVARFGESPTKKDKARQKDDRENKGSQ